MFDGAELHYDVSNKYFCLSVLRPKVKNGELHRDQQERQRIWSVSRGADVLYSYFALISPARHSDISLCWRSTDHCLDI
ncbi:hypothetical protein T07_7874 [Trichinella nelsoni]|uniref:Uncharacterized protein n=1 Tax=Trichinella nelsoni TaxID=6336 RepID=A0A0V0SFF2_9BILA|nr:hypothetical protein T07_9354 [Trichinella nelsoni]KRX25367.1 hypothetical protein T07_7874 [Trichinella nelsoni]